MLFNYGFPPDWSSIKKLIWLRGSGASGGLLPWTTFVGNPLEFDAPKAHALKSCVVTIEPIQSGSGDPSPDNVRPISGWTEAKVWRTGENLLDPSKLDGSSANFIWGYRGTGFLFKANETYILSVSSNVVVSSIRIITVDESIILAQSNGTLQYVTYTPTADTYGVIRLWASGLSLESTNVWLNLGSTASPYSPYTGTSLTIPFGQTVYGGSASYEGNGVWRITPFPEYDSYNGETLVGPWQSSIDKYVAGTSPTIGAQVVDKGGADPSFTVTTAELFDALAGRNVMWTDCENLTVEAKGTAVTP